MIGHALGDLLYRPRGSQSAGYDGERCTIGSPFEYDEPGDRGRSGGIDANVLFAGLTPTEVGLYQVNVTIPAGVTPGPAVPLVLTAAGQVSAPVTVAIQ